MPPPRKPITAPNRAADLFSAEQARALLAPAIKRIGQSPIARGAGLPRPNVSAFLTGRKVFSLESRLRLAIACGCKVTLTVEPPPHPPASPAAVPAASQNS